MEYEKLLKRAYESLPKKTLTRKRFEMPVADVINQGNKTIIRNYQQILKVFNRPERHFFKFLARETASAVTVSGQQLVLNRKLSIEEIQKVIENYANSFVLCSICKKPDTKIIEKHGVKMLKCEACGALTPLKAIK
ncbi:MAG: translation initiation factor IF-2 subunit beta [Candidatus Diapherotrites archaeon]|nr:translation initiation factor IF-2 subunit beta [Candidatus Diapherotrites archaeon]